MAMLSKVCKPDDFELHNSLKLSITSIWGLLSHFIDFESFFDRKILDILALRETILDNSNDASNFSVKGYLPLIC